MTTIVEENEDDLNAAPDFSQLLDLPESTFAGSNDALFGNTVTADPGLGHCPDHPNDDSKYVTRLPLSRSVLINIQATAGVTASWENGISRSP